MSSENSCVLVVDDDRTIRETLAEVLEVEGHAVLTAADGVEALAIVEQGTPNLVLLDMHMPRMDGRALLVALRERGIHVPVIVMSAALPVKAIAAEIGAHGYLPKPFDLDHVLAQVEGVYAQWSEKMGSPAKAIQREEGQERRANQKRIAEPAT